MPSRLHSQRGNIAVYVSVMVVAILFLLTALFQLSLAAYTTSLAWDVRRQRDIESRAVASATKEAILAKLETAPTPSSNTLAVELQNRANGVTNGSTGITITSNAANDAIVLPSNPQFPGATPVTASTPSFSSIYGVGRNLQALLSAGDIADLGSQTFTFTESNTSIPAESPTYSVTARYFSVPLTNFNWIAYGRPTSPGGVSSAAPAAPAWSKPSGFNGPLVNSYSGETGSFPDMFGGLGTSLPYYYRDLVSLTWNAFEYWTSLSYQNQLLASAGAAGTFDFTAPTSLPNGVTWDGTRAILDMATTTRNLVVFVDSVGGSRVRINGSGSLGNGVVVVIRNFSSTPTIIELPNNNSRSVMIYAPNTTISPTPGVAIRGGVLLFPNSSVSASFSVYGLVAYPQTFSSAPSISIVVDNQAKQDLKNLAPRALLVSTKGNVQ